jgi:nicotinate-nucleotide adenylyltransferase
LIERFPSLESLSPHEHERTLALHRIGLFGGSFDPVHVGHLLVARAAREELQLDRLYFVLAAQSPFKPERKPIPANERLRLLRLALTGWDWCEIDAQEVKRGGVSYSIDTVREYKKRFPGVDLFYLVGADQAGQLHKWRAADELARLVEFVVIPRPGEAGSVLPPGFRGRELAGFPVAISSSQIRARVSAKLPLEPLVPAQVAEAIRNNALYL